METRRVAMPSTPLGWYYNLNLTLHVIRRTKQQVAEWAIKTGDLDILQMCDERIVKPPLRHKIEVCNPRHRRFRLACRYGHASIIRYFLTCGAPPHCHHWPASHHLTPSLHFAVRHGWLVAAKLLLENGAKVNDIVRINGRATETAISCAVAGSHVDMVILLLAYGALVPRDDGKCTHRGGRQRGFSTRQLAQNQGGTMARTIEQAMK
jgi:hypothetical protein